MTILQSNSGTRTTDGTISPNLPSAPPSTSRVVVLIYGNNPITTPSGWTLRTSQVNWLAHYWFERAGDDATSSWDFATVGQTNWTIFDVQSGTYVSATGSNTTSTSTTMATPSHTPTAGDRLILATIGSSTNQTQVRTITTWTNSFIELSDTCATGADYPMHGVANRLLNVDGSTAFATTATFSLTSEGRSALIGSYATPLTSGPAFLAANPRVLSQAVQRASTW